MKMGYTPRTDEQDWAEIIEVSVCLDAACRQRDVNLLEQVHRDLLGNVLAIANKKIEKAREDAIEECAKIADWKTMVLSCSRDGHGIASAIRALKARNPSAPVEAK